MFRELMEKGITLEVVPRSSEFALGGIAESSSGAIPAVVSALDFEANEGLLELIQMMDHYFESAWFVMRLEHISYRAKVHCFPMGPGRLAFEIPDEIEREARNSSLPVEDDILTVGESAEQYALIRRSGSIVRVRVPSGEIPQHFEANLESDTRPGGYYATVVSRRNEEGWVDLELTPSRSPWTHPPAVKPPSTAPPPDTGVHFLPERLRQLRRSLQKKSG